MGGKRAGRASRKGGAAVTIIAEGTCLKGEIAAKGPLQLDGSLDGDLDAADAITVGPTGRLTGSLRGGEVRVAGSIEGEVVCRQLTIASGGRVYGDVLARSLVIDPGAVFLGTSHELDADASVPAASFDSAGSPSRDEEPEPLAAVADGEGQEANAAKPPVVEQAAVAPAEAASVAVADDAADALARWSPELDGDAGTGETVEAEPDAESAEEAESGAAVAEGDEAAADEEPTAFHRKLAANDTETREFWRR